MSNTADKSGVNWAAIKKEIESGKSMRHAASRHGLTHQAISQRSWSEGWNVPGRDGTRAARFMPLMAKTRTADILADPKNHSEKMVAAHGKRTPEAGAKILEAVSQGLSPDTAGAFYGVSKKALKAWLKDDPAFKEMLETAQLAAHALDEEAIIKARARGDWKAARDRLATSELTKDRYGEQAKGGPSLNVIINIRGDDDTVKAPMVDVTPKD